VAKVVGLITTNYSTHHPSQFVEGVRPVAATPVLGRYRMIDFTLSNMVNAGLSTIGLIMPDNYRPVIDHVGAGKDWGLDRKNGGLFPLPGSSFGMSRVGGRFLIRDFEANRDFLRRSKSDYVIVSGCNFLYTTDLKKIVDAHIASGDDITVVTYRANEDSEDVNAVVKDDKGAFAGIKTGSAFGDAAFMDLFVIGTQKLEELLGWYRDVDHLDLFDALKEDLDEVRVGTYDYEGYVAPIFSKEAYFKRSMELLDPALQEQLFTNDLPVMTKAHDTTPAKYEPGAHVANSLVSSGTKIYGTVKNSIIGRACVIERGATVTNAILVRSVTVKAGAHIENAIIDRNNEIAAGTVLRGTSDAVLVLPKGND
jgi:glucose-1-phosphate adenylyltransferase